MLWSQWGQGHASVMSFAGILGTQQSSLPTGDSKPRIWIPQRKAPLRKPARGTGKMSKSQTPEVWADWTRLRSLPVGKPVRLLNCLNPTHRGTPYLYANLLSTLHIRAISHPCLLASKCHSAPRKLPRVESVPPRAKVPHRSTARLLHHKVWQWALAPGPGRQAIFSWRMAGPLSTSISKARPQRQA